MNLNAGWDVLIMRTEHLSAPCGLKGCQCESSVHFFGGLSYVISPLEFAVKTPSQRPNLSGTDQARPLFLLAVILMKSPASATPPPPPPPSQCFNLYLLKRLNGHHLSQSQYRGLKVHRRGDLDSLTAAFLGFQWTIG